MFKSLGQFVSRHPWWVIAAWVVVAGIVIATAPKLEATTDQSEFLPRHYESVQAAEIQNEAFGGAADPGAIVVFQRADGSPLTKADQGALAGIVSKLNNTKFDTFADATLNPQASKDGTVMAAFVVMQPDQIAYDTAAMDDAKTLRSDLTDLTKGTGIKAEVTGPAAQSLDSQDESAQVLAIVGLATIVLIVGLLALIFRSVIVCAMPIATVFLAGTIATGLIGFANDLFDLKADSSTEIILFVVLYGIGTDYILFFLFRYREALRAGRDGRESVAFSVSRAGEAIASAGGAVVVAFMALVLSSLGVFRSIGPALAIAVATTVVAALTLVPAIVTLVGPKALAWPSKKWLKEPDAPRFRAVGHAVGRRPGVTALISGGALAVLALFAVQFNPTFDFTDTGSTTESGRALATLQKAFSAGASDPATVIVKTKDGTSVTDQDLKQVAAAMGEADGVASATPAGSAGAVGAVTVVLDHTPTSRQALDDVKGPIRAAAHAAGADIDAAAYVGGTTSIFADFEKAMKRDYSIVFPVAAVLIMLILALLLRSLVAPWYLMASVGLGFAATLGLTTLVFQNLGGQPGLIFMLPIYIYLFVVALGTDYNILMVARLREEARSGLEPRPAAAMTVEHAGPTIAAAGLILAGTFASLMLAPDTLTRSMGFSFAVGIALAAFVMAMFLTPSLTALIGHAAWWPGHGDRVETESEAVSS